ncbi:conserved hypothetical protein [Microbacterium sp. C448]|uniref:amidohydrolase family protein n=1 Tax=Microbacterium sp. C448 TaxID=1177594 RepID=UPI0003DE722C|nr:amidohydrolase family protein [Microbacterium sp. C448]CDJ99072.1 conserved hypothetical protein [Microbacterium sp. C448]
MTMHGFVDMRLRPPIPEWTESGAFATAMYYPRQVEGFPGSRSAWLEDEALLLSEMDEAGIEIGVIPGRSSSGSLSAADNDATIRFCEANPGRFVTLPAVNLGDIAGGLADLEALASKDVVVGVSIEPGSAAQPLLADDPSLDPIYEWCLDHSLPVSISLSSTLSYLAGHDMNWASPIPVQRVAMKYPELKIVISHSAWPWVSQAIAISLVCPNVYLSPDMYWATPNMPGADDFVRGANLALSDRMLFGTAYPTRPLRESVDAFLSQSFDPRIIRKITRDNAFRLLSL